MRRVLMAAVAAVMAVGVAGPAAAADGPALFAWGSNSYGQLGNPDVAGSSLVPVDVTTSGVLAGERVTQVSAGDSHSCVVADGKVWVGSKRGGFAVLADAAEKRVLHETKFETGMSATPVAANGTLFVSTMTRLFAFRAPVAE